MCPQWLWLHEAPGDFNEVATIWDKQGESREAREGASRALMSLYLIAGFFIWSSNFKGTYYTWSNNREGEGNILARLDRAFANASWRIKSPFAQVFLDTIAGSIHLPLVIQCCKPLNRVARLSKFESMWTRSCNCREVIKNQLGSPCSWFLHV